MPNYVCEVKATDDGISHWNYNAVVKADSPEKAAESISLPSYSRTAKVYVREIKEGEGETFWIQKKVTEKTVVTGRG